MGQPQDRFLCFELRPVDQGGERCPCGSVKDIRFNTLFLEPSEALRWYWVDSGGGQDNYNHLSSAK